MKAIHVHGFGGPEVLKVEDAPDPQAGPGQVVVRAKAIGVNPVDVYIRAGNYGDRTFPFTPGFDAAGTVESVGSGVKSVKVGDRVYVYKSVNGTYAEKILCAENQVHPLPPSISFPQGAALGVPYSTAYFAIVNRAQAKPNEKVLVHGGSGAVGIAAVQIARALNLKVMGTASTPEGRELIIKEGAHEALDHAARGHTDFDIILEMLANENLGNDLKMLASRGRVIVIGSRGPVEIDPRDTMPRNADIRGMSLMYVTDEELAPIHAGIAKGLTSGTLRPVVGKEFPLAQAARAHEEVMKSGAHGKIVLIP